MAEDKGYRTTDLGVAAFLKLRGLRIAHARRDVRESGRFTFTFEDPDGVAHSLAIDYANSDCQRFDAEVRSLKKLIYSQPSGRRR